MKIDVYEIITNRIIQELEKGIIPWLRPWSGTSSCINYVSRKPYSFLNELLLGAPGEYLSFNQCKALGGSVKKGAKSRIVVFFKMYRKTEKDENGVEVETDSYPVPRLYHVFNVLDCEGIEPKNIPEAPAGMEPEDAAEQIVAGYTSANPSLNILREQPSGNAFYNFVRDEIVVPCLAQYTDVAEYYSTLFHEMVHSTGVASRLARDIEADGHLSGEYAREELVAEIGSAMLCNRAGLDSEKAFKNSVGYIQSWASHFKKDKYLIISAASKATQAAKYILQETDEEKGVLRTGEEGK